MSVTVTVKDESPFFIVKCNYCGTVLSFMPTVEATTGDQVLNVTGCKCRKEQKAPEYKLCRNCGDEFSIPSFCKECE